MSWNWGSPPTTDIPSAPRTPTPVSSTPSPSPRVEEPVPQSYSSSGVALDLTSSSPLGVYQPREGAGFGTDPLGVTVGGISGAIGTVFKAVSDVTQGVDRLIGTGASMALGNRAEVSQRNVLQQFAALPDSPEKRAVQARIAAEAPNDQYKQSQIAFEYLNKVNAYLFPEQQMPVDNTATGIGWNLLNQLFAPAQVVERTVAGAAGSFNVVPFLSGVGQVPSISGATAIGPGGNRLSNILDRLSNPATAGGVNEIEKWAADQYTSKNWTADQALDFLAGHGAGYSGDFVTNMMGELVLDPSVGVPLVSELAKLSEAGKAARLAAVGGQRFGAFTTEAGKATAAGFAAHGRTDVNILAGLEKLAQGGDRTANTVLKVGGLVRDTVDPLGAIWGRAPTKLLLPGEGGQRFGALTTDAGKATAAGFQTASGRSTDVLENFSGQLSARLHGAIDPGTLGRDFYGGVEQAGATFGKPGAAVTRSQLDVATGISNIARRVLIRTWVAQHLSPRLEGLVTGMLNALAPDAVIDLMIKRPPENFADLVELEVMGVAKKNLGQADLENLANRMARSYGMDADHWLNEMSKWSEGSRSLAHLATYGNETGDLVAAVQRIMSTATPEALAKLSFKPRDLYLMNANTLTRDDAARIIKELGDIESSTLTAEEAAALHASAVEVAKDAASRFGKMPKLALDGTPEEDLAELVRLKRYLEDSIARNALPSQINPHEVKALRALDAGLADLHELGEQGKVPWKLGVAPPEDVPGGRWGLVRDGNGEWHSFHEAWATHVAANATGYLPLAMRVGFKNGKWGVIGKGVNEGVDIMENVINTMSRSISSAMVTQNAKDRMVGILTSEVGKKLRGGGRTSYGFTPEEAQELSNELTRVVSETNIPARGLLPGERWDALEQVIPARLRATGEFTRSDLTSVVMRAYQGDFRVVGATQYFTGALKVKVPTLAIFAERVVPFVRFQASPIFQSQMRVEGTFWNILRGNWAAFGPTPTRLDQEVYLMLERAAGTSVQRAGAEADAAVEMSQQALHGNELAQIASDKWGASWWDKISNAKGTEQLNYLRAIQGDIYGSLQKAAKETGFDLDSVINALREVHPEATPDQLATHYYYEMLTGRPAIPDVVNPGERLLGTAMEASIYGPVNMGKLGVIDGDGFLARAPIYSSNGRKITNVIELRRELANERIRLSEVRQHLEDLNVPKVSQQRFLNYVNFDWNAFWGSVRRQFNLTPEESFQIQNAIAAMAERHGVKPGDFLSQILSPVVSRNEAGTASVGTAATLDDAGQYVLGLRGILRSAREGGSTSEDLLNQLADVFIPHLNPSAQEVLAEALHTTPEGLARRMAEEVENRLAAEAAIPEPPAPAAAPEAAAPVAVIPPEPGTAPLGPGMVRAYHYTNSVESLDKIRQEGLQRSAAKGETYGEPNQIWFSTEKPRTDDKAFVEVHLRPEEITGSGGPGLLAREMSHAPSPELRQRLNAWADRVNSTNVNFATVVDAIPPDRIVTYNEPWMHHYRYISKEIPPDAPVAADKLKTIQDAKGINADIDRAVAEWERQHAAWEASRAVTPPTLEPDAERVMHEFGSWTHEAIRNGLLKGKQLSPEMTDVLDRIGLLPRQYAVPYSFTEAQFKFAALDHLAQKENDAMGLMYWRRQRSWAERTINHPMFGLYPASYMWGKVAPNFIKFLAKNQFGLRTAAGLSAVRDAQLALAARYEFDPEFQKQVESFGASNALWFVSYLLPGAPWDLGAAAPSWANELLRQADDNATRVHNGLQAKPLDMGRLLESEANFLSPARGIEAGFDAASEAERGAEQGFRDAAQFFQQTFGGSPPLAEPVRAVSLQNVLEPQVEQLQQTLLR